MNWRSHADETTRLRQLFSTTQGITVMNKCLRNKILAGLVAIVAFSMSVHPAFAGTTGTEFGGLYNLITGWSTGYLGRTLAIAAFLVGAIVGFAKSTAMPALIGIVFAVLFAIGPGIIDGIASALI